MNHYSNIYLCFGESKVCFGCIFFKDGAIIKVVYDKLLAEHCLKLIPEVSFDFISNVTTATALKINPTEKYPDMLSYFDNYLHAYSNGIVRYSKSSVHADIPETKLKKVANIMFGKLNDVENLIEL